MKAFVIFRDRVSYARQCVEALADAGLEIHVVDNGSTYPPAVQWIRWLDRLDVPVHELLRNQHPQDLWKWPGLYRIVGSDEPYVVTDCDVVPFAPSSWVAELRTLLELHPDRVKVGMGLATTDIPEHYRHRQKVREWETQHWQHPLEDLSGYGIPLFGAAVDTTLAMYQPLSKYPSFALGPALRTGFPYMARHLSWYEDSSNPSEEQIYYETHMNLDFSHWIAPERYV